MIGDTTIRQNNDSPSIHQIHQPLFLIEKEAFSNSANLYSVKLLTVITEYRFAVLLNLDALRPLFCVVSKRGVEGELIGIKE